MVVVHEIPVGREFEGLSQPQEMPVWDCTLDSVGPWAIAEAGFTTSDSTPSGPCLLLRQRVALRPEALKLAWKKGQARGESCHFALGGRAGDFLKQLPGFESGPVLAYLHEGDAPVSLADLPVVVLEPEEKHLDLALHREHISLALTDCLVLPIDHWVDLLWANLLGLGPRIWGLSVGRPAPVAIWRLIWAAIRSCSVKHEKIAAKLNVLGPGARIHPSATVEASVLGKGVQIGAGAVVRGCVLGAGSKVEELAVCEGVVTGENALIQRQALIKFSTMGPESAIGGATQLAVFGGASGLKRGAFGMDQSLSGAVKYIAGGSLQESPHGLLGICLGEKTQIGAGVSVGPGRVLEPGIALVADFLQSPIKGGEGMYRVRDGKMEPWS